MQVGYSRMLGVRLDPSAKTATLVWEHALGYNSTIFGDADRLPSGNIIGCGFPTSGALNDGTKDGEKVEKGEGRGFQSASLSFDALI